MRTPAPIVNDWGTSLNKEAAQAAVRWDPDWRPLSAMMSLFNQSVTKQLLGVSAVLRSKDLGALSAVAEGADQIGGEAVDTRITDYLHASDDLLPKAAKSSDGQALVELGCRCADLVHHMVFRSFGIKGHGGRHTRRLVQGLHPPRAVSWFLPLLHVANHDRS